MSDLWSINLHDVLSAVLSGVSLGLLTYLGSVASIYVIDFHTLISVAVLGAVVSILKKFGTASNGLIAGKF